MAFELELNSTTLKEKERRWKRQLNEGMRSAALLSHVFISSDIPHKNQKYSTKSRGELSLLIAWSSIEISDQIAFNRIVLGASQSISIPFWQR